MVRDAVNGRAGDVDHPLDPMPASEVQHIPRAVYVGRVDLLRRIERQRSRRVHHEVDALQRGLDGRPIADVAGDNPYTVFYIIVAKTGDVERGDRRDGHLPLRQQVADQIDPQEAGTACDQV